MSFVPLEHEGAILERDGAPVECEDLSGCCNECVECPQASCCIKKRLFFNFLLCDSPPGPDCPCLDGQSVEVNWSDEHARGDLVISGEATYTEYWLGEITIPGSCSGSGTMQVALACNGSFPSGLRWYVTNDDFSTYWLGSLTIDTCEPFLSEEVEFGNSICGGFACFVVTE